MAQEDEGFVPITGGLGTIISTGDGQDNFLRIVKDPSGQSISGYIEVFNPQSEVNYIPGRLYGIKGYNKKDGRVIYTVEDSATGYAKIQITANGSQYKQTGSITDWGSYPQISTSPSSHDILKINKHKLDRGLSGEYEYWIPTGNTPPSGIHPCAIIYMPGGNSIYGVDFLDLDIDK